SKELSGDPVLVEKTIHAFALLGYLVQLENNFVFKGGTSILLHISKIKRLSIDIDIIFGGNIENFISEISKIPRNTPFIRFEENKREHKSLPNRRHFKFFYNSTLSKNKESILLDIVLENPDYIPFIENKIIKSDLFEIETELSVKIPTVEGLLGDKLTAFAPNTIGIPFETQNGNSMVMQVVKQLYDIGELFDIASNFTNIQKAFKATFEKENSYRDNQFTKKQVLKDTIGTCHELLQIRLKGYKKNNISNYLEDGIKKLDSHLLNDKFNTDLKAKITASKVFCIANSLLNEMNFNFPTDKYNKDKIESLKEISLQNPYSRLNRLKPILPEAFYYIWQGI
ncbi:MAG: nucleotidyl transferase AbiEii/AbiGii toxin family protein, partial [Candidatus Marinimicrobia bacterium]|nr:nucleotidyl transferase AbiEii/AbiGii toxin family protein [Candidatus Neomarinimicrobiota bacterium]